MADAADQLIGTSSAIAEVRALLRANAKRMEPVLIIGRPGSGKTLFPASPAAEADRVEAESALKNATGDRAQAARLLGISQRTLMNRLTGRALFRYPRG